MPEIALQPKQSKVYALVYNSEASWIGMPGGRGGAKSGGMQRIMIDRRVSLPGTIGVIVMRNYEQVQKYHVDVMLRDYPELMQSFNKADSRIVFPMGKDEKGDLRPPSEIHFSWAPALKDVIRRFRSGSFYDIMVDQAEQFTEPELREMKQACRWKGAKQGACKFVLGFNMGGAGIDFLRKKFHFKEMNQNERSEDFEYVHFFPWDNVEWSRAALEAEGLTEDDYYGWTDKERRDYCAEKSDYGRNLVSQDAPLVKRDWAGSWDALEGTYFGRVWDRDSVVILKEQFQALVKPWWTRWMSQDWGKGHYCPTLWHARGSVPPEELKEVLGWEVDRPVMLTITYREYIAGGAAASDEGAGRELSETDIADEIVERTPEKERKEIKKFYLSPDAFEMSVRRVGQNEIAKEIGDVMRANKMPYPLKADNSRKDGWSLMYNMLLCTKRHGDKGEDAWLMTAECAQLINAIPLLMRDPKDLDDVLKTDKSVAKLEQDMGDTGRYGLKSVIKPRPVSDEAQLQRKLKDVDDPTQRYIVTLRHQEETRKRKQPEAMKGDWRSRLEEQ